jgi:peptidylprolyl isomerase
MFKHLILTAGSIAIMTSAALSNAVAAESAGKVTLQLSTGGPVVIELNAAAPKHAERIKQLAGEGFYNGLVFHRVIEGFMAQTGDPTGTGTSGSKYPDLPAEFGDINFGRGTVGMARKGDPNSANSQFFVCFQDCSFLNRQYTVIGTVTSGMEFVDKVARGEPPASPDKIVTMTVEGAAAPAAAAAPETAPAPTPAETAPKTETPAQ